MSTQPYHYTEPSPGLLSSFLLEHFRDKTFVIRPAKLSPETFARMEIGDEIKIIEWHDIKKDDPKDISIIIFITKKTDLDFSIELYTGEELSLKSKKEQIEITKKVTNRKDESNTVDFEFDFRDKRGKVYFGNLKPCFERLKKNPKTCFCIRVYDNSPAPKPFFILRITTDKKKDGQFRLYTQLPRS